MNIAVNAVAVAAAPSIALAEDGDFDAFAAGKKFETLFVDYGPTWVRWAKATRVARFEVISRYGSNLSGPAWNGGSKSPAFLFLRDQLEKSGADQASQALSDINDLMTPLAEVIRDSRAEDIAGLRAKALVAMWEASPEGAFHSGELNFSFEEDFCSLVEAVAAVTGLSSVYTAYSDLIQVDQCDEPEGPSEISPIEPPIAEPIYAAIKRHQAAYDRLSKVLVPQDKLEDEIPRGQRLSRYYAGEVEIIDTDTPKWISFTRELAEACGAETQAAIDLIDVEDFTAAGAKALIDYVIWREKRGDVWPDSLLNENEEEGDFHQFLLQKLSDVLANAPSA